MRNLGVSPPEATPRAFLAEGTHSETFILKSDLSWQTEDSNLELTKAGELLLSHSLSPDDHCSSVSSAWEERKIIKGFTFTARAEDRLECKQCLSSECGVYRYFAFFVPYMPFS